MEIYIIMSVILLFLAAKKQPVFGQLTLTGELALDWVKMGEENVITARKIEFASARVFADDYNIQDYHIEKGLVALIYPLSEWGNPMLITQKSILKPLEAACADWEEKGANVSVVKIGKAQICRIEFDEKEPKITMFKDKKSKQFAPYEVKIE